MIFRKMILAVLACLSLIQCKVTNDVTKSSKSPEDVHVLVELKEGVTQTKLRDLLVEDYTIKSVKPSNRTLNQYVFTFHMLKNNIRPLLSKIRSQQNVIEAKVLDDTELKNMNIKATKTGTSKPLLKQ